MNSTALILRNAQVCDGETPPARATIWIEGSRIHAVIAGGEAFTPPEGARVVDLEDKLLVPGIIDAHTHLLSGGDIDAYERELLKDSIPLRTLRAAAHARDALDHGVLTMRDVSTEGAEFADVALRDAIAAGLCEGPRILPSGPGMGITGGYMPMGFAPHICVPSGCAIVDGPDAARREVRKQVSHGVGCIKVFADWRSATVDRPTFTRAELEAIVDEATRRGVQVAAHATTDEGARGAIECGVASIEHIGALSRETLDRAAERGVFLVPTLSVMDHMTRRVGATDAIREKIKARWEGIAKVFESALASGVRIAAGTDIGCFPHAAGSRTELALMARLGMPALAVLRAATSEAAALLRIDGLGRIREGAIADLCAFGGKSDASDVIGAITSDKPSLVIQGGRIVRDRVSGADRR